jgi:hypothetical protein
MSKTPSHERADLTADIVEKLCRARGVNTASRFNANAMREKRDHRNTES